MIKKEIILGLLISIFLINLVYAENLEIQIKNNYLPGENVNFKLVIYDDNRNMVDGQIDFIIEDYYTNIIQEGKVYSGEEVNFKLPENAFKGYWAIIAKYNNIEKKELFNVGELKKVDVKIEKDKLIITNIGNVIYDKSVDVFINENEESIPVLLEVGQRKEIRLTAPDGQYDVKVDDGNSENEITFSGVGLTGNVISAEESSNFWSKYPVVVLFLLSLLLVFVIVSVLKVHNKLTNKKTAVRKKKIKRK